MLRIFFGGLLIAMLVVLALAGFRGTKSSQPPIEIFADMDHQQKFQPQHRNEFFADGLSARKPVKGTIPLGYNLPGSYLQVDAQNVALGTAGFAVQPDYLNTGIIEDSFGDGIPFEVNEGVLLRGQDRFNIHCSACHGALGMGDGIVANFGMANVANLQLEIFRTKPDGEIFHTITNGKNTMGAYGPNISVSDRWAIVAYVRALQRSQSGKLADLSPEKQAALQQTK